MEAFIESTRAAFSYVFIDVIDQMVIWNTDVPSNPFIGVPADAALALMYNCDLVWRIVENPDLTDRWCGFLSKNRYSIAPVKLKDRGYKIGLDWENPDGSDGWTKLLSSLPWRIEQINKAGAIWDVRQLARNMNIIHSKSEFCVRDKKSGNVGAGILPFMHDSDLKQNPLAPGNDDLYQSAIVEYGKEHIGDFGDKYIALDPEIALGQIDGMSFLSDGTLHSRWLTWPVIQALVDRYGTEFESGDHRDFNWRAILKLYTKNPMDLHREQLLHDY